MAENQIPVSPKLAFEDIFKYRVTPVVNVMPEFPPPSPDPPVAADKSQDADPAPVISIKLALSVVTVPLQVSVRAVPKVSEVRVIGH